MMFRARRMLPREFPNDDAFTARSADGQLLNCCVEHESGRIIGSLSWTQAVAEARQLNAEQHQHA